MTRRKRRRRRKKEKNKNKKKGKEEEEEEEGIDCFEKEGRGKGNEPRRLCLTAFVSHLLSGSKKRVDTPCTLATTYLLKRRDFFVSLLSKRTHRAYCLNTIVHLCTRCYSTRIKHSISISMTQHHASSSGSSIYTSLHQHRHDTETQHYSSPFHEPLPTSTDCKGYTSTHQTCTRCDASESDAMLQ